MKVVFRYLSNNGYIVVYSSIAQLVEHAAVNRRVVGSSPTGGARLRGQAVKTPPFHGGNRGSIPLGVTNFIKQQYYNCCLTEYGPLAQLVRATGS